MQRTKETNQFLKNPISDESFRQHGLIHLTDLAGKLDLIQKKLEEGGGDREQLKREKRRHRNKGLDNYYVVASRAEEKFAADAEG